MFSLRLKELREEKGLTQQTFADKLEISQSTVGMWESGQREPNFKTVQRIASFFDVPIDYLLGIDSKNKILNQKIKELLSNCEDYTPFADAMGVPVSTVFHWIKGISDSCYDKITEISEYFQVSSYYLLGKTENKQFENGVFLNHEQKDILEQIKPFSKQDYARLRDCIGYINYTKALALIGRIREFKHEDFLAAFDGNVHPAEADETPSEVRDIIDNIDNTDK